MNNGKLDQITLDIIKDSLAAAGEEMFISIARSSKSPVIYEVLDFASGITDSKGKLLTQGNGITGFIGMLGGMAQEVLKKYNETGNMKKGDIFITNDPYSGGGSHLSDVGLVMPIFYKEELIAMAVAKAHWTEVGGKDPGSWSVDAREVYQEGLQMPCLKLCDQKKMSETIIEIIKANVRFPDQSLGDMWSQIAGLKTAEKRMFEICDKFGKDTLLEAMDRLLTTSEEVSRKHVRNLPQGVYEAQEWIEDDGLGTGPININVKVTIKDDRFIVDFTGTHKQVPGPINLPYAALVSTCRVIFLTITDPGQEINDGVFEPIEIIAEEGSIVNCIRPASVSICWETMLPAVDAISKAIAKDFPTKITASSYNTVGAFIISGNHPESGEPFINVAPSLGGWGAGLGLEGQGAQFCVGNGETFNIPVEVLESRYGFLVENYALNTNDDAGAGEFRGGSGVIRQYKMRTDDVFFTGAYGRYKYKPWGLEEGQEGSNNYFEVLKSDGAIEGPYGKGARHPLNKGDSLKITTAIGGGYGNPLNRPVEKVEMDVKNEYISIEQAKDSYGVLIDPESLKATGITDERKAFHK